ncbi:16 kDa beta-galactoside-binding lectin isoform X3 [Opisthocomus hoazin]
MQQGLVVTQLDVQPGECIKVKGKILSDAKGFAVNVGKDSSTLMLHFNPRFDCRGDVNTIVCNSKEDGMWGEEDRKADFPFQHGDKIEMCISFNEAEATVKLPEAEFQFPNRLGMEKIEYLAVEGDFKVKAIKFGFFLKLVKWSCALHPVLGTDCTQLNGPGGCRRILQQSKDFSGDRFGEGKNFVNGKCTLGWSQAVRRSLPDLPSLFDLF